MCTKMMSLFYESFIEAVLSLSVVVWFGNLNLAERNRLGRLVSIAGKVIGVNQSSLCEIYDRHVLRKAHAILDCVDHPLHPEFVLLP